MSIGTAWFQTHARKPASIPMAAIAPRPNLTMQPPVFPARLPIATRRIGTARLGINRVILPTPRSGPGVYVLAFVQQGIRHSYIGETDWLPARFSRHGNITSYVGSQLWGALCAGEKVLAYEVVELLEPGEESHLDLADRERRWRFELLEIVRRRERGDAILNRCWPPRSRLQEQAA